MRKLRILLGVCVGFARPLDSGRGGCLETRASRLRWRERGALILGVAVNPTCALLLGLGCLLAGGTFTTAGAAPGAGDLVDLIGVRVTDVKGHRHRREGGIAPFSLEGHENARRWHRMIAWMTGERLMPPWRAVPGFGE